MPVLCVALVPRRDTRAVARALRQQAWPFTRQTARSGWANAPLTIFWILCEDTRVESLTALLHAASPSRTTWYRSPHAWHADAWLHPIPVTWQGAVVSIWPLTYTDATQLIPAGPGLSRDAERLRDSEFGER